MGVLEAIQAPDNRAARERRLVSGCIQVMDEGFGKSLEGDGVRARHPGRGHFACVQLTDYFFPHVGMRIRMLGPRIIEHESSNLGFWIVTRDAVLIEESLSGNWGGLRGRRSDCQHQ